MNPLISKEIRLLSPAYLMALLLAVAPAWLLHFGPDGRVSADDITFALYLFGFGMVMLALSPFGREFAMNTFGLILAQPLERTRIWRTKLCILAIALATLLGVLCMAWAFRFLSQPDFFVRPDWPRSLTVAATTIVVIFSGALWTTLLFRQLVAAFWFTILIPAAILMMIDLSGGKDLAMIIAMGVYSVAGFLLARRQFFSAQEIAWTGGVIDLPAWRSAIASARSSIRTRRPLRAIFWKEFQLYKLSLMGMCGLFVLHLGVVWLRKVDHAAIGNTTRTALEVFGDLWYIVPLLTGSLSVSEERKLGTIQELLCLPVSRRIQFLIKLLFTLILGGLLSALLYWTAEGIGSLIGASADVSMFKIPFNRVTLFNSSLIFLALSLIGFYASTLTRGIVQALAVSIATTIGLWIFLRLVSLPHYTGRLFQGFLVHYIDWPVLVPTVIWLAWRNFRTVSIDFKLWRRNVLGIAAAIVFILTATTAIYNRAWEFVTPPEPSHGPAQLTGSKPVTLKITGPALTAVLPDGRLWMDRLAFKPGRVILDLPHKAQDQSQNVVDENPTELRLLGKWMSMSGNQLVPGSNWVDAVTTYRETVAIRNDGTLWVSEKPRQRLYEENEPSSMDMPATLVRYGNGTDWKSVAAIHDRFMILLKQDGSLWLWGTGHYNSKEEWHGLREFTPRLLSDDSDWERILNGGQWFYGEIYAWKKDGSAWSIHLPKRDNESQETPLQGGLVKERFTVLDNARWRSFASIMNCQVGLREDGTLWDWHPVVSYGRHDKARYQSTLTQLGTDTNWVNVAGMNGTLMAVKSDGSLWAWKVGERGYGGYERFIAPHSQSPIRSSRNKDWLAVGYLEGGFVSLAADGSLWYWWTGLQWYADKQPLLAPPKRPSKIENIFAKEN